MPTQHEVLIGFLNSEPKSLDEIQTFIDRIKPMPRSTTRARLTELKHKGVIDHTEEGWIVTSDQNGVPQIIRTTTTRRTSNRTRQLSCIQQVEFVGVEIEGGWEKAPAGLYPDASVSCGGVSGEICSKPLSLEKALEYANKNYPTTSDRSCGLHIHVSFTNKLAYMQLMSRTFYYKYFLPRAEKFGKENGINEGSAFWVRLEGKNPSGAKYCRKGFHAEKQSKLLQKDGKLRYHHLNYCYKQHTTIECRLFPTFQKKELGVKAIKWFVETCNDYLKTCKPERATKTIVNDSEEEVTSFDI